jgi:hypothetical protein
MDSGKDQVSHLQSAKRLVHKGLEVGIGEGLTRAYLE